MSVDLRVQFGQSPAVVRLSGAPRRDDRRGARPAGAEAAPLHAADAVDADSEPAPRGEVAPSSPPPEWLVLQRRLLDLVKTIEGKVDELERRVAEDLRGLEPQVVELAYSIAKKLIGRELERGTVDIGGLVQAALDRVLAGRSDRHNLHIRVSPQDRELVGRVVSERIEDSTRVEFEADPALKPGCCEIRSDMRRVRVDLELEMQRLRETLLSGAAHE